MFRFLNFTFLTNVCILSLFRLNNYLEKAIISYVSPYSTNPSQFYGNSLEETEDAYTGPGLTDPELGLRYCFSFLLPYNKNRSSKIRTKLSACQLNIQKCNSLNTCPMEACCIHRLYAVVGAVRTAAAIKRVHSCPPKPALYYVGVNLPG